MSEETYIRKAVFNSKVRTYWLLSFALLLTSSVVGIPLLLLWFPIGYLFTKRYLGRMECLLTDRALKVRKGILVQIEKTIPLEKITDMGMVQGPIMRYFDLHTLTVEEAVLNQRDAVSAASPHSASEPVRQEPFDASSLLSEIRELYFVSKLKLRKQVIANHQIEMAAWGLVCL